jgi:predicted nucleic acid-binding protein
MYEQALAPSEVKSEFERKAKTDRRFIGLHFPRLIIVEDAFVIPESLIRNPDLDPGEIAALALVLERRVADVLIDEKAARVAAITFGLRVSGLLGILIEGKRRGLIQSVSPLLDALSTDAKFWIDPRLRERVLRIVAEGSIN